jgi:hypothetical protein
VSALTSYSRIGRVKRDDPLTLSDNSTERDGYCFTLVVDPTAKDDVQAENHHGIQSPGL